MYFFTKFTYNEYIGPYFLSHVVLRFSPSDLPGTATLIEVGVAEDCNIPENPNTSK
jgi:hypothetical protein